jgi:peptidoglycan hydrolase-like protein with peptidoglycan-binding domain
MSYHQTIYNLLRGYGLSEAGALGMLGNWECESNCEPYRVQGDYQASRAISKAYVNAIQNGTQDRERFATDQKGFGLAQWTYPQRKRNLWDRAKNSIYRIDSCEFQVEFAILELSSEYSGLLAFLKTAEAIYDCCDRICREYERPAVNNVPARYEAALRIRKELDLSGTAVVSAHATTEGVSISESTTPKLETWPPRTIDEHCSGWAEVWLLQSLLKCRGYNVLVDGIWGSLLTDKVKQFQTSNGLDADGAVGPVSWAKLMERR